VGHTHSQDDVAAHVGVKNGTPLPAQNEGFGETWFRVYATHDRRGERSDSVFFDHFWMPLGLSHVKPHMGPFFYPRAPAGKTENKLQLYVGVAVS